MEFRRQALLASMQDLSEDCWSAGWNTGLERDLYRIVFEGACPEYGMGWINATERNKMSQWAILTDCWWVWSASEHRPVTISLVEAEARFQRIPSKTVPAGLTVKEALAIYEASSADDWELEPLMEREIADSPFIQWLNRAREVYRLRRDPAMYLQRRFDFQFVFGYGTCQIDLVQPSWLPSDGFLRADGCKESEPCGRVQLCPACGEDKDPNGD